MRRIILIGFMGSGKSTLGKKIANLLDIPFIDSDQEIERLHGISVNQIFQTHGETAFRQMETELIKDLENLTDFVFSTGGGMPCFLDNMDQLNNLGTTYYLKRSPKELADRLKHAKTQRPLIKDLNEQELVPFIENMLFEREKYYKKAQVILNRDDQKWSELRTRIEWLHPSE